MKSTTGRNELLPDNIGRGKNDNIDILLQDMSRVYGETLANVALRFILDSEPYPVDLDEHQYRIRLEEIEYTRSRLIDLTPRYPGDMMGS